MSGDGAYRPVGRRGSSWAHGNGLALGVGMAVLVAVGASTVGVTWASLHGRAEKAVVDVSPAASTVPGTCSLLVGDRVHTMDVDRARTLTMIAGVGTQVGAIPEQTARVVDIAMGDVTKYLPSVNNALMLLARDDSAKASPLSLAEVQALTQPAAMSCIFDPAEVAVQKKAADGLTQRADFVKKGVLDAFGKMPITALSTLAPVDPAAQAAGMALTVSLAPVTAAKSANGWVLANWLVAHGSVYNLDRVSYADHKWQASTGWQAVVPVPSVGAAATPSGSPLAKAAAAAAGQANAARDLDRLEVIVAKGN